LKRLTFGIQTPPFRDWPAMVDAWQRIEQLGWESIWLPDHFVPTFRPERPWFEAWTLLSALATHTTRVRLGALVSCNTFRPPALLAKMAVTVDHVSGGRLELGLGAGWVEFEHRMFGVRYPADRERVGRLGEAVRVLDLMLRNEVSDFDGEWYQLEGAISRPAPVQQPRPPFTLAAHGPRMLRLIAPFVDRWNSMGSPAEMAERGAKLDEALAAAGRDPAAVIKSVLYVPSITPDERPWDSVDAFADFVGRYGDAGMTDFILQPPINHQDEMLERVSEFLPGLWERSDILPMPRT
jgi:alkanesulfonate monooxygenase SsuD/methylene tetrahydromethanopterin reductase-like flavin-dependent oxidoreductase (luciferase family)